MVDRDSSYGANQIKDRTVTQLELNLTNTPTNAQFIQINMPTGDFTAVDIGSIGDITTIQTNIVLNAFRIAINGSLTQFNMVDGIVDEYEDENSVDNPNSTNEEYDSVNDLYSTINLGQPFAHFKCNDNAANTTVTDDGTGANNGTGNVNTSNYSIAGKINEGFDLDGTEFINIDAFHTDIATDTTGSFAFWINPDAVTGDIITFGDTNANEFLSFRYITGNSQLQLFAKKAGVNQWLGVTDSSSLTVSSWNHVVVIHNGTDIEVYINGISVTFTYSVTTDKTVWFSALTGLDNGRIGALRQDSLSEATFYQGIVDDIRYYQNTILIQSEIDLIYNSGNGTEDSTSALNMSLISDPFTAEAVPSNARIVLFEEDIDSITLNTDLKAFVTRDAGQTFTTDFATDDKLDITSHGFSNDDRIMVTSSAQDLPAGLDSATVYYVINVTTNDFELSLTSSGSAVDITDNGTGTHTAKQVSEITLANDGEYEAGKNILTGSADISGQPSGTSMEYQLITANNKDLNIHGTSIAWD